MSISVRETLLRSNVLSVARHGAWCGVGLEQAVVRGKKLRGGGVAWDSGGPWGRRRLSAGPQKSLV